MIRLILLLLWLPTATFAQGKLFVIGGGKRPTAMIERLIKEAGVDKQGYIVVLPMASEEPDSAIFFVKKQFLVHGISEVMGIIIKEGEEIKQSKLDSISSAKMIYITGGDQNRFMEVAKSTDLTKAIKKAFSNSAVIAGTSAGAAVMSRKMITGNELKHKEYSETFKAIEAENIELGEGLGLLASCVVDQHFVYRSRHNRLISTVIENPQLLGIGIDEATALLIKGNEAEVVGESQVLVYSNPKISKAIKNGKLGARGLALDVYLPGEKFTVTSKQ